MLFVSIGVLGIGVSALLYAELSARTPLAAAGQKNIVYPTQYSDTHITKNAIISDQRFNDLATFKKENFLASAAASLQTNKPSPAEAAEPEKGTWLWTPTLNLTPSYWNTLIAGAKKNGIRSFYLSLDSYLDIYVLPEGRAKEQKKATFDSIVERFIRAARKNGMSVDAEAGWRNWAEPGNEYKAFAIVDYVLEFNAAHTEKFRGFQYDVEPYLLESYQKDKKAVLRNFLDLVNKTVTRLDRSDLSFSVVIPDFYDGTGGETPRFFYGWDYGSTLIHLLEVLDRRPGSALLVMAYRNRSGGNDGSIDISRDEIRAADEYQTKVIVAQETGDVSPPSLTFYNTSLSALNSQIQNIQKAFADNASYNGIAIHYVNALLELE